MVCDLEYLAWHVKRLQILTQRRKNYIAGVTGEGRETGGGKEGAVNGSRQQQFGRETRPIALPPADNSQHLHQHSHGLAV